MKPKDLQKLKSEYKTKFQKQFKEEEEKERKAANSVLKESKNKVRDEFMKTFYVPLR